MPWRLLPLDQAFEDKLMELAERRAIDAAIGSFISNRWLEGLLACGIPAVNVFDFAQIGTVPGVGVDERAIGRAAARHLNEQGARRFLFVGEGRLHFVGLRREGFLEALDEGKRTSLIEPGSGPALEETLRNLRQDEGPFGVFCTTDRLARIAITSAQNSSLRPGRDLLVVGVDDDPSESVYAGIGLSSFRIPSHAIGFRAAQLLAREMAGETVGKHPHLAGTPELVARDSSLVPGKARLAEGLATYLDEHLADPALSVENLARTLGVSRRGLEVACRDYFDESPYHLLAARRLARARKLLAETDSPVQSIGERCGYPGQHHFSAWFKKQTGLAPREYRKQIRTSLKPSAP